MGINFRKLVFWMHLSCGVSAGLVVLMMSITGVLLTYERQMMAWADRGYYSEPADGAARQPLDNIIAAARNYSPDAYPFPVTVYADPAAPVSAMLGPRQVVYLNPYSSAILGEGAKGIRDFFNLVLQWHRWFNVSGDSRATAKAITGASNLMFLFLVFSGMYLWLPPSWKWLMFRTRFIFTRDNINTRARDFNWHHVFGIWSAVPLAIVVATATVFSYPWAGNMVYRVFGEEPPARPGPPEPARQPAPAVDAGMAAVQAPGKTEHQPAALSIEELYQRAAAMLEAWNTITIRLPKENTAPVTFTIDRGNGGQPQKQATLSLDPVTARVILFESFADQSPGRRARALIRRLHTGEALGIPGQTVAGLVSFGGVMLVWTGLALAYRRLVVPLFYKRGERSQG
jgi:uncharacterized iron-regulated membrane protein